MAQALAQAPAQAPPQAAEPLYVYIVRLNQDSQTYDVTGLESMRIGRELRVRPLPDAENALTSYLAEHVDEVVLPVGKKANVGAPAFSSFKNTSPNALHVKTTRFHDLLRKNLAKNFSNLCSNIGEDFAKISFGGVTVDGAPPLVGFNNVIWGLAYTRNTICSNANRKRTRDATQCLASKAVGVFSCNPDGEGKNTLYLDLICAERGKGAQLMNALLAYANLKKFKEVALDSVVDKIAFYRGLGFQLRKECSALTSGNIVPVLEAFEREYAEDPKGLAVQAQLEIMQQAGLNKQKDGECGKQDLKGTKILEEDCDKNGYSMRNCDLKPVAKPNPAYTPKNGGGGGGGGCVLCGGGGGGGGEGGGGGVDAEMRGGQTKSPRRLQTKLKKRGVRNSVRVRKNTRQAVPMTSSRRKSMRRKSPQRKSPRRKSPQRKSPQRKSPRRKSPRQRQKGKHMI